MKVYIINLRRSVERRENMLAQVSGKNMDWEFIDAFDARSASKSEIDSIYEEKRSLSHLGRPMSIGEIGCAVSHRIAYRKMISDGIKQAIILEDDVILGDGFEQISGMLSEMNFRKTVVHLENRLENATTSLWKKRIKDSKFSVSTGTDKEVLGGYGYFLDIAAANALLGYSAKIFTVADDWKFFRKYARVKILQPSIVTLDERYISDIWKTANPDDLLNTISRPIRIVRIFRRLIDKSGVRNVIRLLP